MALDPSGPQIETRSYIISISIARTTWAVRYGRNLITEPARRDDLTDAVSLLDPNRNDRCSLFLRQQIGTERNSHEFFSVPLFTQGDNVSSHTEVPSPSN